MAGRYKLLASLFYGSVGLFSYLCTSIGTKAMHNGMMKAIKTTFLALLAAVALAGCSSDGDNEPAKSERYIKVDVLESIAPKGSEFYSPKPWSATTMLFDVPASTLAAEQPKLAEGIALQHGGSEAKAAYSSGVGYIAGAEFGTYTLLVYCPSNITNGYLSGRYTYKQLEYNASNCQYSDKCLFVWEDMSTNGGFYSWQMP